MHFRPNGLIDINNGQTLDFLGYYSIFLVSLVAYCGFKVSYTNRLIMICGKLRKKAYHRYSRYQCYQLKSPSQNFMDGFDPN
jgi:hypothetical protein